LNVWKMKPIFSCPQVGEGVVAERRHVLVVDQDPARGGVVEAPDQVQEGRLPRARGAGDRDELAGSTASETPRSAGTVVRPSW